MVHGNRWAGDVESACRIRPMTTMRAWALLAVAAAAIVCVAVVSQSAAPQATELHESSDMRLYFSSCSTLLHFYQSFVAHALPFLSDVAHMRAHIVRAYIFPYGAHF